MALINIHDEEEMFGLREVEDIASPHNAGSDADDIYDDDVPEGEAQPEHQPNEDSEAPDPSAPTVIKPKRVIKNPQPKFDAARLCGPRGIGVVQKFLSDAPYRGKGYETEDLGLLLQKLKHWAHRLYPKLPFLDSIAQIEKLGNKKAVQVNVKRLRLDMYDAPTEDEAQGVVEDDDVVRLGDAAADVDEPDVFDELLRQSGAELSLQERVTGNTPAPQPAVLSAEQKERIERNRQLALQRQHAKIAAANLNTSRADSSNCSTPQNSGGSAVPAGQASPDAVQSRKRNLDESEEVEDENIQPTQEEVRKLREKLLGSVISLPAKCTDSVTSDKDYQAEFNDDYDAMDIDAAMDALEDVENLDEGKCADEIAGGGSRTVSGVQVVTGARASNLASMENLDSTALNDVEVITSVSKPDDDPESLGCNQFESHPSKDSEVSSLVGCQVSRDSSPLPSNTNKLSMDVISSTKDQPCNDLTSPAMEVDTLIRTSSNIEPSLDFQTPESASPADSSQTSSISVGGAGDAMSAEDQKSCSASATAEDRPADPDVHGDAAAAPGLVAELPDKIDSFGSEDCDVSR